MRTELSFLMDLFLNDEVSSPIKRLIADRIREVEEGLTAKIVLQPIASPSSRLMQSDNPIIAQQAPSMQRIMERNADILSPTPVTPAAAAALQARANLLINGMSEKPEPGRKSPRKL